MGKIPNPRSITAARIARTENYAKKIQRMFSQTVNDIIALPLAYSSVGAGVMYSFESETSKTQKQTEKLLRRLQSLATLAIKTAAMTEWEEANKAADSILKGYFTQKALQSTMMKGWNARNGDAMQAFLNRSDKGMNLSDRVWQSCRQLRDEMEVAITVAVGDGTDAGTISRHIRHCLNDPDLMFRRFRYKDENGNWQRKWKKRIIGEDGKYRFIDYDKDSYKDAWTGRGYYKSSAQNAMRVARTETNMAYRHADNERWQTLDFVLGQRIILSNNHPCKDICDELSAPNKREYQPGEKQGVYPKDFLFEGWHPQCFCFVVPILVDEKEIEKMNDALANGEQYEPKGEQITEYPKEFRDFCTNNADKIREALRRGTAPYFIRNNAEIIDGIINPKNDNNGDVPHILSPTISSANDDNERKRITEARKKFDAYPHNESDETRHRAFDENTGGYYVTLKGHQFSQVKPPADIKSNPYLSGGQAELRLVDSLHKMGKQIELLPENGKGQGKPDMSFDGNTWDSKYIPMANVGTIRTYIKDARKADCVIFHWEQKDKLKDLENALNREIGNMRKLNKLAELPSVYYFKNGELICLWEKQKR